MVRMTGVTGRRAERAAEHSQGTEELKLCIDACRRCHEACEIVVHHCLHAGGAHAEAHHIRLLMDCAQICQVSADFMLRQSDMHAFTCKACATICEQCAEDCARFTGDKMMDDCADACRRCAEECRHMGGMAERARGARITVGSAGRRRG